ncbi:hypothetical protein BP6252_04455 [Coleophoma cylindrospora]|uniref:Amidoligase enzyme n=1 Tax=Coleophoma cylindrospora TaxID=1849047 RepID=A0A3D8S0I7_9HELO|nr:hypothetical protein BP6252_04455 [Coleophoma cylindrospora]
METALSFGIELEFAVALLKDPNNPLTAKENQNRYQHIPSDSLRGQLQGKDGLPIAPTPLTVHRHICQVLVNAGTNCEVEYDQAKDEYTTWIVTSDLSIESPLSDFANRFHWYGVEVKSPARYYFEDSITEIKKVCRVLTENYLLNTNESTGLHVHVGLGSQNYSIPHLRRLAAFVWAFENYFDTLHPKHRINTQYTRSMRYGSGWVEETSDSPTVKNGVRHFLTTPCDSLSDLASEVSSFREMAYNFFNLQGPRWDYQDGKKTVEFRQHEGSLDEDVISHWIHVCVGIVQFCRCTSDTAEFDALFDKMTVYEDVHELQPDANRTTVIDLLKAIGLEDQAEYYATRGGIRDIVEYTTELF